MRSLNDMGLIQVRETQNAYSRQTAQRLTSIQCDLSSCKESFWYNPPILYYHICPPSSIQCSLFIKPNGCFNVVDLVFMHLTVHITVIARFACSRRNKVREPCGSCKGCKGCYRQGGWCWVSALLAELPEQNTKYLVSLCFSENKRCEMDTAATKCHWETLSMTKS